MLVTDFRDEMCWWKLLDVDDGLGHFGYKDTLSDVYQDLSYISVKHKHSKDVTNINKWSPTLRR